MSLMCMLMLLATTSRGDNVTQAAMRNTVVKRAVREMLALPAMPKASKQHLLRGFFAAEREQLPRQLSLQFPLAGTHAQRVLKVAMQHKLTMLLQSEGFDEDCIAKTLHCLASVGDLVLLLHGREVAPPPPDFLFDNIERSGFIVQRSGGGFKLRYLQPGTAAVRIDHQEISITIQSSLISLNMPLTLQALEIFLRTDRSLDDLALAYAFNRSIEEEEAVYWHELSDARNLYDEFAGLIVATRDEAELNEAEMEAVLQENEAALARWLRKDMLLEHAATLLADKERYSLDNVSDEPSMSLDGKSARQIITAALAQRK